MAFVFYRFGGDGTTGISSIDLRDDTNVLLKDRSQVMHNLLRLYTE